MSYSRCIFAAFLAVAAGTLACIATAAFSQQPASPKRPLAVASRTAAGAASSLAPSPSGESFLNEAALRLDRYSSIAAKMRQQGALGETKTLGAGTYLQASGASMLFRFELRVQADDDATSLQQVCDGQFLWMLRRLGDEATLGRADVRQVYDALSAMNPAFTAGQGRGAGHAGSPAALLPGITIGGLGHLARSLNRSFQFSSPVPAQWGTARVYALRGIWKPAALARLVPEQTAAINSGNPDWSKISASVPNQVVVLLGRDDLFPYRIEYRRDAGGDSQQRSEPLSLMEFFDVQFNVPLERQVFHYEPGDIPVTDLTAQYIERLRGS